MRTPRGHSNPHVEDLTVHPVVPDKVMIPIEGGASVYTVKPLPPLALSRDEWKRIGDRMNWWMSPAGTNGGAMWIEFHDRGGRVYVEDLGRDGIHNAEFQCTQMLEELETAKENLDAEEADEEENLN